MNRNERDDVVRRGSLVGYIDKQNNMDGMESMTRKTDINAAPFFSRFGLIVVSRRSSTTLGFVLLSSLYQPCCNLLA